MSVLPREASFAEEVADYFLAFRGSGLALSPLDVELLMTWQERGVPYVVVCRGIRRAAELKRRMLPPNEPPLRSLRACQNAVEEEYRRYKGLTAEQARQTQQGRAAHGHRIEGLAPVSGVSSVIEVAQERLRRAGATLRRALKHASAPVQAAIERVLPLAEGRPASPIEAASRMVYLDEALALGYLRALPFTERRALMGQVRAALGPNLSRMSPRARRTSLRAHRVLLARAHGRLPELK
jgi:hypothetical protein